MCYHYQRTEALAELEHDTVASEAVDEREAADDNDEFAEEHSPEEPENEEKRPEPIGLA